MAYFVRGSADAATALNMAERTACPDLLGVKSLEDMRPRGGHAHVSASCQIG